MPTVTIDPDWNGKQSDLTKLRKVVSSVKVAERITRTQTIPTIAFKKGALREGVNRALDKNRAKIVAKANYIKISLRKSEVVKPDYARYHIHPGSKYGSAYKKPSTIGTKPFDTRVYNRRLARNIILQLPDKGFKVTKY